MNEYTERPNLEGMEQWNTTEDFKKGFEDGDTTTALPTHYVMLPVYRDIPVENMKQTGITHVNGRTFLCRYIDSGGCRGQVRSSLIPWTMAPDLVGGVGEHAMHLWLARWVLRLMRLFK